MAIEFLVSVLLAFISIALNIVLSISSKKRKNQIAIWAKDAKSMASSIVGIQENIKTKKISSLQDVSTNIETILNFANSMYVSMEEELGKKSREILKKKK